MCKIIGKASRVCQLKKRFYIHTLVTCLWLINIAPFYLRYIFFTICSSQSQVMTHFRFQQIDLTIPGRDSKVSWKLAILLPNIHTKLKLYSCSGTVFFNANTKFITQTGLSMYLAFWSLPYISLVVHDWYYKNVKATKSFTMVLDDD